MDGEEILGEPRDVGSVVLTHQSFSKGSASTKAGGVGDRQEEGRQHQSWHQKTRRGGKVHNRQKRAAHVKETLEFAEHCFCAEPDVSCTAE